MIGTARINQPWGHLQVGAVVRTDQLDDGQYFNNTYIGYGGTVSGDVHPFSGAPGPLGKDDLGFGTAAGVELGGQVGNGVGIVTNYGGAINVPGLGFVNPISAGSGLPIPGVTGAATTAAWNARGAAGVVNGINVKRAYDGLVRAASPSNYVGWVWYQHWWTENLRSTVETSGIWSSIPTNLTPGQGNKLLAMAHANLIWSPVAFVDLGVEYGWGHRVTTANFKGDAYELIGSMRVRF
jgi:DcaP outer membrane protein